MKRLILTTVLAFVVSILSAQRFAYVDSEYILDNIPEYTDALAEVDELSIKWQKEIEERFQEIDKLFQKFQAEAPLLSEDMRKKRENEIIDKEREAKDLQKKRFGAEGDLFKQRQEQIRPIQDKVYTAIEKRAIDKNYVFVFDRSDNANLLYADTRVDISNDILNDLGLKPSNKKTIEIKPELQQSDAPLIDKSVNLKAGSSK
ncbi:MAG: OmpH family outer membrane protein [Bacteroidales bacterium]|jgi:outer membrane protein|nr:OmpH family outer membrane protein [Bacteroidales bacterium]